MESVTSHSKIFQALCGNNAFQRSETDVLLPFWRIPPTKLPESRRVSEVSETTRTKKKDDGYFSCTRSSILISEEICHEVVVALSVVLLSYTSRVRQHSRAAVAQQLNSQTGKIKHESVRKKFMGDATICSSSTI